MVNNVVLRDGSVTPPNPPDLSTYVGYKGYDKIVRIVNHFVAENNKIKDNFDNNV
jgi:hypothetical protein